MKRERKQKRIRNVHFYSLFILRFPCAVFFFFVCIFGGKCMNLHFSTRAHSQCWSHTRIRSNRLCFEPTTCFLFFLFSVSRVFCFSVLVSAFTCNMWSNSSASEQTNERSSSWLQCYGKHSIGVTYIYIFFQIQNACLKPLLYTILIKKTAEICVRNAFVL